jgi:hypothetical protein
MQKGRWQLRNEEELIALENLIAEAQETMDLGIEDID